MKYTGHERDLDTGQDYMHARYYYEHLGRFLSVDPRKGSADHPGSLNRYAYVHGNPALKLDPDGREALVFIIGSGSGGGKLGHAAIYVTTPFGDVGLSYATKTKFDDGLTNFVNDYLSQGREVTMFILETNPLQDLMLAAAILTFKDDNPMFGAYPAYNCSSAVCLVVNVGTDGELRMLAMSPWTLKKKLESGEIASQNGVRIDDAIDVVGKSAEEIRAAERRAVRDAAAQALLDSTFADVMAFHELINPTLYAGAGGQCIVAGAACIPWAF